MWVKIEKGSFKMAKIIVFIAVIGITLLLFIMNTVDKNNTNNDVSGSASVSSSVSGGGSNVISAESYESEISSTSSQNSATSSGSSTSSQSVATPVFKKDDWKYKLVNKSNKLEEEYPVELESTSVGKQFDARAVAEFDAMIADAKKDGIELLVNSTHRRFSQSEVNYNAKVSEYVDGGMTQAEAKKEAAKLIAPPGYSEHNLGLAADIITKGFWNKYADLVPEFQDDPGYKWLIENCANYGFILRYPENKTLITGIVYEPWHYRYVGKEAAKFIMDKNITLEEFVANYTV